MALRPSIPLTDKRFQYTSAVATNIRERFDAERARIKREQAQQSADTDKVLRNFEERRRKAAEAGDDRR